VKFSNHGEHGRRVSVLPLSTEAKADA